MASAPTKHINKEQDSITKRNPQEITNTSRIIKVKQASQQEGTLEDHPTLYVPIRVGSIKRLGSIRRTRATRAANQGCYPNSHLYMSKFASYWKVKIVSNFPPKKVRDETISEGSRLSFLSKYATFGRSFSLPISHL